jgi:hypothetical protein
MDMKVAGEFKVVHPESIADAEWSSFGFKVSGPQNKPYYVSTKNQGGFHFTSDAAGQHDFCFVNHYMVCWCKILTIAC